VGLASGPLYSALEGSQAVGLPCIRIPTTGTDDRVHKYKSRANSERMVTESRGIVERERDIEIKEKMAVDPHAWRLLPETRLYGGAVL
jgi:hypothetical protein